MLPRPSEAPEPSSPMRPGEELTRLLAAWSRIHAAAAQSSPASRFKRSVRSTARRVVGQTDQALSGDLIRAVDALAARCDG